MGQFQWCGLAWVVSSWEVVGLRPTAGSGVGLRPRGRAASGERLRGRKAANQGARLRCRARLQAESDRLRIIRVDPLGIVVGHASGEVG
jgi:hypothetical protein